MAISTTLIMPNTSSLSKQQQNELATALASLSAPAIAAAAAPAKPQTPSPTTTPAKTYLGLSVPEWGLGGAALAGLLFLGRKFI